MIDPHNDPNHLIHGPDARSFLEATADDARADEREKIAAFLEGALGPHATLNGADIEMLLDAIRAGRYE